MHGAESDLIALLWLLLGSLIMPLLSSIVRVPSAVLLVAFGVLIGPRMSGLVESEHVVHFLYEVGFLILMFLAGMEIDFNALRERGWRSLVEMIAVCLAIFALAFGAAWLLNLSPLYGLALGATSVGLPLAILKETGRLRSQLGQSVVLLASVGEFLTVLGMTLYYFGSRYGMSFELVVGLGKLLGVLLLAAFSLRALMAVAWWRPESFAAMVDEQHLSEIGVRMALALMIIFADLAIAAGVEAIVGGFLAGALLAFVLRGKEVLEQKLAAVGHGLFIPIFFIIIGMRFDPLAVRLKHLSLAGVLLLLAFVVRIIPSLWLWFKGTPFKRVLATASLLSAPLTLVVAIAAIGVELGEAGVEGHQTLIVLALASGVVFPILFRLIVGAAPTKES